MDGGSGGASTRGVKNGMALAIVAAGANIATALCD